MSDYSFELFIKEAKEFYALAQSLKSCWELIQFVENDSESFCLRLVDTKMVIKESLSNTTLNRTEEEMEMDKANEDRQTVSESKVPLNFEFHIVFSQSYSVPTLYFRVSHANGKQLKLEEVWEVVPKAHENATKSKMKWEFVTQQEHPYLGRPFFYLHPCHTAEAMKTLRSEAALTSSYLLSWLSHFGPFVNLNLSHEFYFTKVG
jgi:ubiquitin-like-conjugating enzyme ATG10